MRNFKKRTGLFPGIIVKYIVQLLISKMKMKLKNSDY